ncbi:hypothetical protein FB451DRAFT_1295810, partial [Mycena latifolia]
PYGYGDTAAACSSTSIPVSLALPGDASAIVCIGAAGTRSKYAASSTAGLGLLWCRRVRCGLRFLGDRRHRLGDRIGPRRLLWLVGERAGVAAVRHEHRGTTTSGSGAGTGSGGGAGSSGVAGGSATEGLGAGGSTACGSDTLWRQCGAEMRRDAGATSTKRGRFTNRLEVRIREWSRFDAYIIGKMWLESEPSLM